MTDSKKADVWAIARDVTSSYSIDDEDRLKIRAIIDVFMYDANERTNLCEMTPSYWLEHLYTYIEFIDGVTDDDQGQLDSKYCYEPTEDAYVHCVDVERVGADRRKHVGEFEWEVAREKLLGDLPF